MGCREGVDRNLELMAFGEWIDRRPPCGGVDRNLQIARVGVALGVAPRVGAWIETT